VPCRLVAAEFVVTAAQVLNEGVPGGDGAQGAIAFQPALGLSRVLSRPWSACTGLLAYLSVTWQAAGTRSSSTRG
jgi:hypothetical protein